MYRRTYSCRCLDVGVDPQLRATRCLGQQRRRERQQARQKRRKNERKKKRKKERKRRREGKREVSASAPSAARLSRDRLPIRKRIRRSGDVASRPMTKRTSRYVFSRRQLRINLRRENHASFRSAHSQSDAPFRPVRQTHPVWASASFMSVFSRRRELCAVLFRQTPQKYFV